MIAWQDGSGRRGRFYDASTVALSLDEALTEMLEQLRTNIIGKGNAAGFDILMLEVNCDTGRLLAAATTEAKRSNGMTDGCSLRLQELQDYWYELVEEGVPDEEFTRRLMQHISNVGRIFREKIASSLEELRQYCSKDGFKFVVFGSEPGLEITVERFAN